MDEPTAIGLAEQARQRCEVPPGHTARSAEQRIIELTERSAAGVLVRDVRVWVVHFQARIAWVELAVDQITGNVVRTQRSRTA